MHPGDVGEETGQDHGGKAHDLKGELEASRNGGKKRRGSGQRGGRVARRNGATFTAPSSPRSHRKGCSEGLRENGAAYDRIVAGNNWAVYRKGGSKFRQRPTCGEYSKALEKALDKAGYDPVEVTTLVDLARRSREAFGLLDSAFVPRVPNPLNIP